MYLKSYFFHISVNSWVKRFETEGISGLETRPGRGRKPIMDSSDEEIVRKAIENDLVASRLNFDQAILYRTKGFIHLSLKKHGVNRKQILFKEEGV